jgi:uroporphyrin-III C-methyltransferase
MERSPIELPEIEAGWVWLAGAGPGDPGLLTLQALQGLRSAEVVVYDALVGEEILGLAGPGTLLEYAGKRGGKPSPKQTDISRRLIQLAREGRRVLRLKGGDPFVFGRGGEELERLLRHGIEVELVPGITAATGCAAVAGIPLTHRDHASAVTFVSGQGKEGAPDLDWAALAASRHTLAVYMGVAGSERLSEELIAHGRDPETPVAVIERGSLPEERKVFGTLQGLGTLIAAEQIEAPALIVIGEVVRLAAEAPRGTDEDLPLAAAE